MTQPKFPWLRMRKKTQPELPYEPPIWFGPRSNGEYFRPQSDRDRKLKKLVLRKADENARRLGMDRREFLASSMGMATTLFVLNEAACSSDDKNSSSSSNVRDGGGGADSGGDAKFCAPPEAMYDESVACSILNGDEFIFDVQTHWFKPEDLARFPLYLQTMGFIINRCTEDYYVEQMFLQSDTTVAALTSWPGVTCPEDDPTFMGQCGLPLSNASMAASRDKINQLSCNTRRIVQHVQLMPQDPLGIDAQLRIMEESCNSTGLAAWKLYPGFGEGFKMDDMKGRAIVEKGLQLGVNLFCVHKGLQIGSFFNPIGNYPDDIGVVATDYPDANFVIYHSAICAGHTDCSTAPEEGPYSDTGNGGPNGNLPTGVNALIKALADKGIGPGPGQTPNRNVYGEVGSAINEVQGNAEAAAHFFGKLMKYLGPDHVLWGTDSVIYGSPQSFIDWFRTLEIPQSMQDQYGYPPLNAENKAKIFGLNAAKLYGINAQETRCQVNSCQTAMLKRRMDEELGKNRHRFQIPGGPKTYAEFAQHVQECVTLGRPG